MGVAAGHHRLAQPLPQPEGQLLGALTVLGDVLAVQVQKIKAHQQLRRQVGDVPAVPEGVPRPHQDRVFGKEFQQLRRREEPVFGLVRLQAAVHLPDGLHRADAQHMPAFRNVGLHAGKNAQSARVFKYIGVPVLFAPRFDVAVKGVELLGVEMLGQADGVQAGAARLAQQPVGVFGGERQIFCQLPMCVKIHVHSVVPLRARWKAKRRRRPRQTTAPGTADRCSSL